MMMTARTELQKHSKNRIIREILHIVMICNDEILMEDSRFIREEAEVNLSSFLVLFVLYAYMEWSDVDFENFYVEREEKQGIWYRLIIIALYHMTERHADDDGNEEFRNIKFMWNWLFV